MKGHHDCCVVSLCCLSAMLMQGSVDRQEAGVVDDSICTACVCQPHLVVRWHRSTVLQCFLPRSYSTIVSQDVCGTM